MRRFIALFYIMLMLFMPGTAYADDSLIVHEQTSPTTYEQIDIGYYECWLHADGITWQNGTKPGSTVIHNPTIKSSYLYPGQVKGVKSVEFYPGNDIGSYYNNAVNNGKILSYSYYNYQGLPTVNFQFQTTLTDNSGEGGLDVKKWWQSSQVQGRRFYLPVKVTWELNVKTVQVALFLTDDANTILDIQKFNLGPGKYTLMIKQPYGYTNTKAFGLLDGNTSKSIYDSYGKGASITQKTDHLYEMTDPTYVDCEVIQQSDGSLETIMYGIAEVPTT